MSRSLFERTEKLIRGILLALAFSCLISCKNQEKDTQTLLNQAEENKLRSLYYDLDSFLQKDDTYYFDTKKNSYQLKDESLNYLAESVYNFHIEHHVPILTDKVHPENWDNYFHYYDLLLKKEGMLSSEKRRQYMALSPRCAYCQYAFQKNADITWADGNVRFGDFSEFNSLIDTEIKYLNEKKKKLDEIEASTFHGVWGCDFGMSSKDVLSILHKKFGKGSAEFIADISAFNEPYSPSMILFNKFYADSVPTYGGNEVFMGFFCFINDTLCRIFLGFSANRQSLDKLADYIIEQYKFNKNYEYINSKDLGYISSNSHYGKLYKNGEIEFWVEDEIEKPSILFINSRILKTSLEKAKEAQMKATKNRNDF